MLSIPTSNQTRRPLHQTYTVIILALFAIISFFIYIFLYTSHASVVPKTYPESSPFPLHTISDLYAKNISTGTYNTEGYIVFIYNCPPCPKRVTCKPCFDDHIVLSENNQPIETIGASETKLILPVKSPKQFHLGQKYRFSIQLMSNEWKKKMNAIKILGYTSVP